MLAAATVSRMAALKRQGWPKARRVLTIFQAVSSQIAQAT